MRRNLRVSTDTPVNNGAIAAAALAASEAAAAASAAATAAAAAAVAAAEGAALVVAAISGLDTSLHDGDGNALETRAGSEDGKSILIVQERTVQELLLELIDLQRAQFAFLSEVFK